MRIRPELDPAFVGVRDLLEKLYKELGSDEAVARKLGRFDRSTVNRARRGLSEPSGPLLLALRPHHEPPSIDAMLGLAQVSQTQSPELVARAAAAAARAYREAMSPSAVDVSAWLETRAYPAAAKAWLRARYPGKAVAELELALETWAVLSVERPSTPGAEQKRRLRAVKR